MLKELLALRRAAKIAPPPAPYTAADPPVPPETVPSETVPAEPAPPAAPRPDARPARADGAA